jgi:hypothetical protein
VIDLLDSELVGSPHVNPVAANLLRFGADPTGRRDSAAAFDRAIAFAKQHRLPVYVPPGTFQVNRHIVVDDVTIEGAGNWHTVIKGRSVALSTPAPDGSVHTGVGFYGRPAEEGGSRNVHLRGFALVVGNLVADPVRQGSGIQLGSRFGAQPFTGRVLVTDNTTVRAGTFELNWRIGLGAIWFYALERDTDADVQVVGNHFLDNTYNAIMFVSEWSVKDFHSFSGVHFKDVRVDGTGTSVLSARSAGSATFENVDARNVGAVPVNNCGSFHFTPAGSEFTVGDLGGNDGWLAPWLLPNRITCDDRPPVVPPPAPSAWTTG